MTQAVIILGYLGTLLLVGILARRRARPGPEDFFLASRTIGPILLFLTMAATNFSAFTVFGFAGAGYRFGYAYYPIMAFGTGFMALTFLFLGIPIWQAGKRSGAITPPELIGLRFRHKPLHIAYLSVMVVFTIPYLAIQPMGAGYALQGLLGIPYAWGTILVTGVVAAYVLLGGMRGEAWADALQAVVMLTALTVIFLSVAASLGGLAKASNQLFATAPDLFQRPGKGAYFLPGIWFSYMALWFLCDPMFPQLFQRFLAGRGPNSLRTTALLYPLITGVLFFFPVAIGVLGRLVVPGLEGKATDQVLPLVAAKLLPSWAGAVAIAGGLAALMSTMDSQLLVLSAMVMRDTAILIPSRSLSFVLNRRATVALLAIIGLAIALRPVATILEIATETFTGLAVLFPLTLAAVYWRKTNPWAGFASILVGESLVVLYHFKLLPTFGLLPVLPVTIVTTLVLVMGSLIAPSHGLEPFAQVPRSAWKWVVAFGSLFLLAHDFWNWQRTPRLWLGLPDWLWFFFGLNLLLFLMILLYTRVVSEDGHSPIP